MAEYIDRETLRKILKGWRDAHADVDDEQGCGLLEDVIWEVDAQSAADVVPVVRCKDCKHYLIADEFEGGKRFMCEVNHFSYINSDGDMRYCSYGERKDDKHEH